MKNRWILAAAIILAMGMTACTAGTRDGTVGAVGSAETDKTGLDVQTDTGNNNPQNGNSGNRGDETANPGNGSAPDGSDASLPEEEIAEGDPVIGIVDSYENDIIVIRDMDDQDIVLYFSTLDAQITEGDSPIAPGDVVEITYKGVQGDAEHPGRAVKVVAESMMYNRERDDK